tara:strand:+ start:757 stop:927 length:171 start_codon:yes stop_codon:yes gene_type:complete
MPEGDPFTFNGKRYKKIKEERVSCCKIKHNALDIDTNEKIAIQPKQEVTPVRSHDE